VCGPATAASEGFYLGFEVGWSHPDDVSWAAPSIPGGGLRGNQSFNNDALWGGTVGDKWANGLRAELEISHADYGASSIRINNVGTFGASGDITQSAMMGNAAWDFPIAPQWALTVGAGVGSAILKPKYTAPVPPTLAVYGSDSGLAWQIM